MPQRSVFSEQKGPTSWAGIKGGSENHGRYSDKWGVDRLQLSGVFLVTLFLLGFGLIQVYSTSFIYSADRFGDSLFFFKRHLTFVVAGVLILFALQALSWANCVRLGQMLFFLSTIGLVLTLVPGLGVKVGGAYRWLQMPLGFRLEPSEFFKISFPFALAGILRKGSFRWPLALGALVGMSSLLLQPDFGSFVLLTFVGLGMFFVFGLPWKVMLGSSAIGVLSFLILVVWEPYRWARVQAFLDPWSDREGKGFQIIQSLLSYSNGGLFGQGLGDGKGKLFFLPEAHTDFTLSVLGEEFGFVGMVFTLVLFGSLIFLFFRSVWRLEDPFHQAIALGLTLWFSAQTFFNVLVSLGLVPTKGMTLPFLSYGGSSLIATCLAVGWLIKLQSHFQSSR